MSEKEHEQAAREYLGALPVICVASGLAYCLFILWIGPQIPKTQSPLMGTLTMLVLTAGAPASLFLGIFIYWGCEIIYDMTIGRFFAFFRRNTTTTADQTPRSDNDELKSD